MSIVNLGPSRVLRLPDVRQATGLSRSSIYAKAKDGTFPKPIPLGSAYAVGWLSDEVAAWLEEQVTRSRGAGRGL
jgi:prophage regulatory protein